MREAGFIWNISLFVPFLFQQGVKLIVFNVDDYFLSGISLIFESADSTHWFTWLPWDCVCIHFKTKMLRDSKDWRKYFASQSIGILQEYHPFFALLLPFFCNTILVKQRMNISMSMRFRHNFELRRSFIGYVSSIVNDSRDILLLYNIDPFLLITKIVISLKQG